MGLAEGACPSSSPKLALPAHGPQAPAAVVTVAGAAGLRPAAMAAAAAQAMAAAAAPAVAAAADSGGVEACGRPGGPVGCESDWDPFHDDWHAW